VEEIELYKIAVQVVFGAMLIDALHGLTGEDGEPLPPDVSLRLEMNLDGAAEGLLPRQMLPVTLRTFRDAW